MNTFKTLTITVAIIAMMIVVIKMTKIQNNVLSSDQAVVWSHEETRTLSESKRKLEDKALNDFYRKDHDYVSDDTEVVIENNKQDVLGIMNFDSRGAELSTNPVFVQTDSGATFIGRLPKSKWKYVEGMVEYENGVLTYKETEEELNEQGIEYLMHKFYIDDNQTEKFDAIYNLDYYTAIPSNNYNMYLGYEAAVILKTKENSVVSYTIIGEEIDRDYTDIKVLDIKGNVLVEVNKDSLSKTMQIPVSDGEFVHYKGHLITIKNLNLERLDIDLSGHRFTEVTIDGVRRDYGFNEDYLQLDITVQNKENIRIETYGRESLDLLLEYITKITI